MAIITNVSRTQRAIDFFTKNLYFGFGRTTVWTSELSPDEPVVTATEVEEVIFLAKVTSIEYVVPGGTEITFKDTTWTTVDPGTEDLFEEDVKHLYVSTVLTYGDFELASFRQIGLLEDPTDSLDAVCSLDEYDNSEINSQGILHYLDNRIVTNRQVNQQETISIILEF